MCLLLFVPIQVDAAAAGKQYNKVMELLRDTEGKFNLSILTSIDSRKKFQEREITRWRSGHWFPHSFCYLPNSMITSAKLYCTSRTLEFG